MKMDQVSIQQMESQVAEAENLLKSLANGHRLMVLCHLVNGELSVGELEEKIGVSQSSLSQHLARLRGHKIVDFRKEGTTVFYHISDTKSLAVLELLHKLYCEK